MPSGVWADAASAKNPVRSVRPRSAEAASALLRPAGSCRCRSLTRVGERGAQVLGGAAEQAVLAAGVDGGPDGFDGGDEPAVPRLLVGPRRYGARLRLRLSLIVRLRCDSAAPDARVQVDGGPDAVPGAIRCRVLAGSRVPVDVQRPRMSKSLA